MGIFLNVENKIIFEFGDAIFHEEKFSFKLKNSGGEENTLSQPSSSTSHLQNQENFEMELEVVKELELKRILVLIIMFLTLRKISKFKRGFNII